jgi:hypothetical protein
MAITNKMIIELYKIENNITEEMHTYARWQELGYQVKKGEKSKHKLTIWRGFTKTIVNEETGEEMSSTKIGTKTSAFFLASQVEKLKIC